MTEGRRLAAILALDMVGYSARMGRDQPGTVRDLMRARAQVIDPLIAQHRGIIAKTIGDGLLAEFASVVDAVSCAIAIQSVLAPASLEVPPTDRTLFRAGVHLGDVLHEAEEIYGDGINVAARLEGVAPPGGLAVSQVVRDAVANSIEIRFRDRGAPRLKNIAQPLRVFTWLPQGIDPPAVRGGTGWRVPVVVAALAAVVLPFGFFAVPQWRDAALAWCCVAPGSGSELSDGRSSLAVMPFANLSGDADEDYFSAGLTEDVIAALGRFSDLTVMSRNAVVMLAEQGLSPAQIGQHLRVGYLVEGSVRRAGERVRVHARLAEAGSGKVLWAQQYDAEEADVFAVQTSISRSIAGTLAVNLARYEEAEAIDKPTGNLDAYELVLRARHQLGIFARPANRKAREYLARALALDPDYAAAYALKGLAYLDLVDLGWVEDPLTALDEADAFSAKALSLDPSNIRALNVRAAVASYRGDFDEALAATERILSINPSDSVGLYARGHVLLYTGRIDEAVAAFATAYRFNPFPLDQYNVEAGLAHYLAKDTQAAIQILEDGKTRYPQNPFGRAVLAAAYARDGQVEAAAREVLALERLSPFFDAEQFGTKFTEAEHREYLQEGLRLAGWPPGARS